jgi:hypothetical protein
MLSFQEYSRLGPEATKKQDKEDLAREKAHLQQMSNQSKERAAKEDEAGEDSGAFRAKGHAYAILAKNIKEDAPAVAAPTVSVAGVAGSGDSRLPATQREPGVSKKRTPLMMRLARRKLPNM